MTEDAELPSRIANALKDKKLDGIITFSDEYVIATARAADILGLRTEPVQGILQAHNKYDARKLLSLNIRSVRVDTTELLDEPSVAAKFRKFQYPLIVEPARGAGSRGIKKINDTSSLHQAIRFLEETGFSKFEILIETYIDKP